MNITDFSLKLNGFPIKEAQKKLREIQSISESDFEVYINQAKKDIVTYHLKNNSFYSSINNGKFTSWNALPILTKKKLQIPLQERLSRNVTPNNV